MLMEDVTVAAVCMHSEPSRVEKNLGRMARFATEAASGGADMICFPELSLTGYVLDPEEAARGSLSLAQAESLLTVVARDSGCLIIAGLAEKSGGGGPLITQVAVSPEGAIGVHRKSHLGPPERSTYQAGDAINVISFRDAVFGIQLCYETHFPEISTTMALAGAEMLFFPHASPRGSGEEKLSSWLRHLPARAFDNGVYVVACNQVGETSAGFSFPGVALIIGPDGRVEASCTGSEERILVATLRRDRFFQVRQNRMKYFLPHRRPALYSRG
jgi:N-carbamoylputrescine amidase